MKIPSIKADEPGPVPGPQAFAEAPRETAPETGARSPIAYLGAMWRGEVPLAQVVWRDMVLVGTVINIATMGLAFLVVALGASTMTGIAVHLSPVPYNIFLVASVWRSAERAPADAAWTARIGSLLWLLVAFVI